VVAPTKPLRVNCPTCAELAEFNASNRWRPFCSERCKRIDLGAWASEQYRIAGSSPDPTDPAQGDIDSGSAGGRH
jgi:endogenous inhibitor of DNA gyrase (YacG/DUF329 family)